MNLPEPTTTKLITINNAKTAAVNQSLPWLPIDSNTPLGVKLLLINRYHGTGTTGVLSRANIKDFTHWQGWPKFVEGAQ